MKAFPLTIILLLSIIASGFSQAKSNLVVFSEQGEKFYLILNGIQQNSNPETNVKVTDLIAPSYKVKIIFDDNRLGEFDKSLYFNDPAQEYTYVIKRNKKGKYVLRYMNQVPIAQAPAPPQNQSVIVFTTSPASVSSTTTITETTTNTSGKPDGVSVGINVNDEGMNVDMNINQSGSTVNSTTTSYSTTTTTTTTSTQNQHHLSPAPHVEEVIYVPGYAGPVGCPMPMSDYDFSTAKNSIASKSFEDSKLTIAKQIVGSNCLLCSQVKEIMNLFDFEDTKLQFAKFAYDRTYDRGNYYQLNDAFDFESSIDELNKYVISR
ncbi:MAG: hypothetical protein C0594_06120 [Marinilabiliales bacterium]|nr:MAG: hypothetical protein C0594_06120 [Marinilabiliales bacterium]